VETRTGHGAEYPGHWPFAAMRKGEARMRRSKGPKPLRRTPLFDAPARREHRPCLIHRTAVTDAMYVVWGGGAARLPLSRFPPCKIETEKP